MERRLSDRSIRMAQRTGAKRLLALWRKTASAGVVPALAVVVLGALAGCGGSSSDTTASSSSQGAVAANGSPSEGGIDSEASTRKAAGGPAGADSSAGQGPEPKSGKHGAQVVIPKGPREQAPTAKET